MTSEGLSYAAAGVDIEAYERVLERVKPLIAATHGKEVAVGVGPFAGLYALPGGGHLAASADGVGTKIKVAIAAGAHRGIGTDIVNHCVNDIATAGARPLFFLDYFATGKLNPDVFAHLIEGMTQACREAGCALLGGETAEMPGVYALGDYDLAGFIVGLVEPGRRPDPSAIRAGDAIVGLPSSGLHTNGYSLARKLLFEVAGYGPKTLLPEVGATVGDALLRVHRSYLKPIRALMAAGLLRGAAHITGGGITDNTPRMLPKEFGVAIETGAWKIPPLFEVLRRIGDIPEDDYRRTLNLGVGMILAVPARVAVKAEAVLSKLGETPFRMGSVMALKRGRPRVEYL